MDNKRAIKASSSIKTIDEAIHNLYPDRTAKEIREIRSSVIDYVANGLVDGYEIALVKQEQGQTRIKVLRLVERPLAGMLDNNTNKKKRRLLT